MLSLTGCPYTLAPLCGTYTTTGAACAIAGSGLLTPLLHLTTGPLANQASAHPAPLSFAIRPCCRERPFTARQLDTCAATHSSLPWQVSASFEVFSGTSGQLRILPSTGSGFDCFSPAVFTYANVNDNTANWAQSFAGAVFGLPNGPGGAWTPVSGMAFTCLN